MTWQAHCMYSCIAVHAVGYLSRCNFPKVDRHNHCRDANAKSHKETPKAEEPDDIQHMVSQQVHDANEAQHACLLNLSNYVAEGKADKQQPSAVVGAAAYVKLYEAAMTMGPAI